MLADPSAAVVREAVVALVPVAVAVPTDVLERMLQAGRPRHLRKAATRLLRVRGPVDRVLVDLVLWTDDDDELRLRARDDLDGWLAHEFANAYANPSAEDGARLGAALRRVGDAFDQDRVQRLRFSLGLPAA